MDRTCLRAAAAVLTLGWALLLAAPWQPAHAVPIVLQKITGNGTGGDAGSFTAAILQGANNHQALLQLFTAADATARISGLFVQDTAGAIAHDAVLGDPSVQLSPTQIYELRLANIGGDKVAVIKTVASALGISAGEAKVLVETPSAVIRTATTANGNDPLKLALQNAGATVAQSVHTDPAAPPGTNLGVTLSGNAATGYKVELSKVGQSKLNVVRAVRDITGLSLFESEQLVDKAPSTILANASAADTLAARQALQTAGATVTVEPIGLGTVGLVPIALPPGSTGLVPDIAAQFDYQDFNATPTLQLTLDLNVAFADFLAAWYDQQFVLGLGIKDFDGASNLYLAAVAAPIGQVPEPPTIALLAVPLLVVLRGLRRRPLVGDKTGG